MGHKGLTEPHVLLASSNPVKLIKNLRSILGKAQLKKIDDAVCAEAKALFLLGKSHFDFSNSIPPAEWRQVVSRLYYAAYNVKRSISLRHDGSFSTESKDHERIDQLPSALANSAVYGAKLRTLREDRNLADYSHLAKESDLVIAVPDARVLVTNFLADAKTYLNSNGVHP